MRAKLVLIALLLVASFKPTVVNAETIKYGEKFDYAAAKEIEFADFRLKFLGMKPNSSIGELQLGEIYEFQIASANTGQKIAWSSGTGDIGPETFKVQRKCFWLELRYSDDFGKLKDNQAIVSLRSLLTDCGHD